MKELNEMDCVRTIKRTMGVNVKGKTIIVNKDNHAAGLTTWKKIDYLVNTCGYSQIFGSNVENNGDVKEEREERRKRLTKQEKNEQKGKFKVKLAKLNFKKI